MNPSFLPRGHTWGAIVHDSLAAAVKGVGRSPRWRHGVVEMG